MVKDVAAIVAAAYPSRGIGSQGKLPWSLPPDMEHFKRVTSSTTTDSTSASKTLNAVIMGRKTWESIPPKFRPLPNRLNVVLTQNPAYNAQCGGLQGMDQTNNSNNNNNIIWVESSLEQALDKLQKEDRVDKVFVIGGGQVYDQAIQQGYVQKIYYTEVAGLPDQVTGTLDTFFPTLDDKVWGCSLLQNQKDPQPTTTSTPTTANADNDKENHNDKQMDQNDGFELDPKSGLRYRFVEYTRKTPATIPTASSLTSSSSSSSSSSSKTINVEELQYLNLCREILETGIQRGDRTGTGTLSKFGTQMRFSLRDGRLPLLTTKRTFWRGVAEELLWFISGSTNANLLTAKGIHIWDGNGSRDFLDQRGLQHREVGDLGPVYGFQWRHFGATYVDMHTDYTGQGVDQLRDCIHKIRNQPEDRRILMSAWNPADLELMALPPCHMFCQFYVDTVKNELSCQMYQRSADLGLGVPFNIASYALLTHLVAHVTGRKPGDFVHTIGDAHIYLNHVEALQEQLKREPRDFPTLRINPNKTDIDDFVYDDFEVIGYNPHKPIKMKMAV